MLVRAIHESSHRSSHEFVSINCAAIPSTLIESELFGYESGSFTGGRREGKKGLFDLADKGTIFFDEVGDFELNTQAKILRVLEEREFRRVGGQKCIPVDTRVLSATNRDLDRMMLDGKVQGGPLLSTQYDDHSCAAATRTRARYRVACRALFVRAL